MPQDGKAPEVPPVSSAVDELAVQDNPHSIDRIEAVRNTLRNIIFCAAGLVEDLEGLGEEPILPQGQPGDPASNQDGMSRNALRNIIFGAGGLVEIWEGLGEELILPQGQPRDPALNQDGMFRLFGRAAQPQAPENEDGNLQEPENAGDIEGPDNVNLEQAGPVAIAVDVEVPLAAAVLGAEGTEPADVNSELVRRAARSWGRDPEAVRPDTMGAEVVRPDAIGAEAVRPDTMGAEVARPDTTGVDVEEPTDSSTPRNSRTPPSKRPRLDLGAGSSKDSK